MCSWSSKFNVHSMLVLCEFFICHGRVDIWKNICCDNGRIRSYSIGDKFVLCA